MKTPIAALIFVMALSGVAFARDVTPWGFARKDGTYMEPRYGASPYNPGNAAPPADNAGQKSQDVNKNEKKRINPYDNRYNSTYNRPRY